MFVKKGALKFLAGGACLLAAAAPSAGWAKKRAAPPVPTVSPEAQAVQGIYAASQSDGIAAFYAYRRNAPFWLNSAGVPSPAVSQMLVILKRARLDGFADGPALAAQAEAAIAAAQGGDAVKVAYAERLLSSAWVRYVQTLRKPVPGVAYGDPYRAPIPARGDHVLWEAARAPSLELHLAAVSDVNPIYARLRDAIQTQVAGGAPDRPMLASLERTRMFPAAGRFIMVDVASQRLFMVEDGVIRDSMKVVVGKAPPDPAEFQTPMVASTIHYVTFNPYWHVTPYNVRSTVSKNVLGLGQGYLKSKGYQVVDGYKDDATILDPTKINWKAVQSGEQQVWVRQLPGPTNSMGALKFQFPNPEGIYLHDTPDRALFNLAQRTKSSGCIRLEDAKRLARWLLGRDPIAPSSKPELHVQLPQGMPVYVTYLTAWLDGDRLTFAKDVYGRDTVTTPRVASANSPEAAPKSAGTSVLR